jgi:hypothetical protein
MIKPGQLPAQSFKSGQEKYDMRNLGYRNEMYIIVVPGHFITTPG